jgi:monoamine oxidase
MGSPVLDVAVIGAGLSGLVAAQALAREQLSVEVFEAEALAGGRVRSIKSGDDWLELGAEFVGPRHKHFLAMAEKHRVGISPSGLGPFRGLPTRWRTKARLRDGRLPPMDPIRVLKLARAMAKLARLAATVPPEAPWDAPNAGALDAQSFAQWMEANGVDPIGRALVGMIVGGHATVHSSEISLLQVLWWIARSGGLLQAIGDGSAMYVTGGAQLMIERITEERAFKVRLKRPVHGLTQRSERVALTFVDNTEELAHRAIVTAPIPALAKMVFKPALSEAQQQLLRELRFGTASKIVASVAAAPPVRFSVDSANRVLGWARGKNLALHALEEAADPVQLGRLADAFGIKRELVEDASVQRWSEERYIGGTHAVFKPGQLTALGPVLRKHHGDEIFFAGAERTSWPNSMEGAIESGLHIAAEVGVSLGHQSMKCAICGWRPEI